MSHTEKLVLAKKLELFVSKAWIQENVFNGEAYELPKR